MAAKKKNRTLVEIDKEIASTQQKLVDLRKERSEALQRDLQQTSADLLAVYQEAFNTEDKEMSLEDLTAFVKENIAKAKEEKESQTEQVETEEVSESVDVEEAEEETESEDATESEDNNYINAYSESVEQEEYPYSVYN